MNVIITLSICVTQAQVRKVKHKDRLVGSEKEGQS